MNLDRGLLTLCKSHFDIAFVSLVIAASSISGRQYESTSPDPNQKKSTGQLLTALHVR